MEEEQGWTTTAIISYVTHLLVNVTWNVQMMRGSWQFILPQISACGLLCSEIAAAYERNTLSLCHLLVPVLVSVTCPHCWQPRSTVPENSSQRPVFPLFPHHKGPFLLAHSDIPGLKGPRQCFPQRPWWKLNLVKGGNLQGGAGEWRNQEFIHLLGKTTYSYLQKFQPRK